MEFAQQPCQIRLCGTPDAPSQQGLAGETLAQARSIVQALGQQLLVVLGQLGDGALGEPGRSAIRSVRPRRRR